MDLLERHRRYWDCEAVDEPLLHLSREGYFHLQPFIELGVSDGILGSKDVPSPESFIPFYERVLGPDPLDRDVFWVVKAPRSVPWLEAIAGCAVHLSRIAQAMAALPGVSDRAHLGEVEVGSGAEWHDLLMSFMSVLSARFGEKAPIGQTLMRGPSDMLLALLGPHRFCIELHDHPREMKDLALRCTELWIQVLKAQLEFVPPLEGGFVSFIGIWAPAPVAAFQEDATSLFSAATYKEIFRPCDEAIVSAFPYSHFHLHSSGLHVLDAVLEINGLTSVNVVVESEAIAPSLQELVPALRRVQERGKALHILGSLGPDDIAQLTHSLSPNGLCLVVLQDE